MAEDRPIAISSSGHLGPDEVAQAYLRHRKAGIRPRRGPRVLRRRCPRALGGSRARAAAPQGRGRRRRAGGEPGHRRGDPHDGSRPGDRPGAARRPRGGDRHAGKSRSPRRRIWWPRPSAANRRHAPTPRRHPPSRPPPSRTEREQAYRQAEQEAAARLEAARHESDELLERARVECRSMVQQAQELRTKVLTDLTNRRRVLHLQIEQLRAGRERLSETIQGARRSVDDIADDLLRAEDEARLAAEAAGRTAAGPAGARRDTESSVEAPAETTSGSSLDTPPGARRATVAGLGPRIGLPGRAEGEHGTAASARRRRVFD